MTNNKRTTYWRDPHIIDADISDLPAVVNQSALPEAHLAELIESTLLENGVPPTREAVMAVQKAVEGRAWKLAGDGFRQLLLTLPDTPTVIALRFLILGGESLREMAKRAGCSEQAASKALKMLRKSSLLTSQVVSSTTKV